MISFINGPFEIGKTTAAEQPVERIPDAILYYPEVVGALLRHVLDPVEKRHDFQDYALWPEVSIKRFENVADSLRSIDPDLHLFRPDEEGGQEWCLEHLEVCLEASRDTFFGTEINANGRASGKITGEILQIADELKADRLTATKRRTNCPA